MENKDRTTSEVLDEIEDAAKNGTDCFSLAFDPAFVFEGRTYKELAFDFSTLTGADFISISNEISAHGRVLVSPAFSPEFISIMCAKACREKIGADLLQALPLRQFNRLWMAGRDFLLR